MLNKKQIRLPLNIKIQFLVLEKQKFLVFNNIQSNVYISLNIPSLIKVRKEENFLILNQKENISINIDSFYTYLKNFLLNFRNPSKKTLILKGLGLKATIQNNSLSLKLGYSHENTIKIGPTSTSSFFIGKKYITIIDYNKLSLGNFAQKIYSLKKANCYKGRGLYFKEKKIITKTVKKT